MSHDCCFSLTLCSDFQGELYTFSLSSVLLWGGRQQQWLHGFSWSKPLMDRGGRVCAVRRGICLFWTSSLCRWSPLRGPLLSPVELCPISSHLWDTFFFRLAWALIRVCKQYFSFPLLQCMVVSPSRSVTYVAVLSARKVISVALDEKEPRILGNGETRGHSSCWQRG